MSQGNLKPATAAVDAEIGERLKTIRKQVGMSQEKLGAAIGITFQQVQKYEKGTNRVSCSALIEICKALGCHPMDILEVAFKPLNQDEAYKRITAELSETRARIKKANTLLFSLNEALNK